jgi:hypothetical protein
MKFLFVTILLPHDLRTLGHGVIRRMRMFIDAMKGIGSIEMLIFVRPGRDVSALCISELERSFLQYWDVEIKVGSFEK